MSNQTRQDINRVSDEINRRAAQMLRELAGDAWEMLVNGTPVDTPEYSDDPGVCRGNWNFAVGQEDTTFSEARANPHGPVPEIPNVPLVGELIVMSNHTPYAEVLEFGGYPLAPKKGSWNRVTRRYVIKSVGGYSQQAPQGWVRLTAAQLAPMADGIVANLRSL